MVRVISGWETAAEIREGIRKEVALSRSAQPHTRPRHHPRGRGCRLNELCQGEAENGEGPGLLFLIQDNRPADITEDALLSLIRTYNKDPKVHGILVELPLPGHVNEMKALYAIDPDKEMWMPFTPSMWAGS